MKSFSYYNPVRCHFGPGTLAKLGECAAGLGKKACVVSYKDIGPLKRTADKAETLLREAGVAVVRFYEAEPNPDIATIARGADLCRREGVDVVVGIGGGSAMDAAKAVAAGVLYRGDPWNMVFSRHDNVTAVPPTEALPTIMIPTLPATGSEMNMCSVVSNRAIGEKSYIWAECLFPRISLLDPELTYSLPAKATGLAAADAISHVLEIYLNGEENSPLQHAFQEGVMRVVMAEVGKAQGNPSDADARANLMWASTCAINGWASPADGWTPIHQVGHNLTSLFGVSHGASLSALMPAWMRTFSPRRTNRYCAFAENVMGLRRGGMVDAEFAKAGVDAFEQFLKRAGCPVTLAEVGVDRASLPKIVEGVKKVSFGADGMLACVPPVSADDILRMLENAGPKA